MMQDRVIRGSCHCGAVAWEYRGAPTHLTSCNCSVCRRLGGLWAYGTLANVRVTAVESALRAYVQGDRTLAFCSCNTCGCTTHWVALQDEGDNRRIAVNMTMADPAEVAGIRIRRFDGADSWGFLD